MIPDETVEQVREAADIVGIIGEYVPLKRTGADFRGPCPFHQGTRRNFSVSPAKRMYHCFVCNESGDVFKFLTKRLGVDWPEAVRIVGEKAGIEVRDTQTRREGPDPREPYWELNATAAGYFRQLLWDEAIGESARDYLSEREISREVAEEFGLGFAPREIGLMRTYMNTLGFDDARLLEAGLLVQNDQESEPRPRFRNRLMFPILDVAGRHVGFGGRLIGPGDVKYLNSSESPVFSKGKILYGLNRSRNAIRRADRALVVEGYFDAVRLMAAGIEEVVAPLGTALTEMQVTLLRKYSRNVFLLYDSDAAGLKATFRAGDELLQQGFSVRVVTLPPGEDPDSFVKSRGAAALEAQLDAAIDVFERKIQILERAGWFGELQKKRRALDRLLPTIRATSDQIMRDLYLSRAGEVTGVDRAILLRELDGRKAPAPRQGGRQAVTPGQPGPRINLETRARRGDRRARSHVRKASAEKELLRIMLLQRSRVETIAERIGPDGFRDPCYREIFVALLSDGGATTPEELASKLDPEAIEVIESLTEDPLALGIDPQRTIDDSLAQLEVRDIEDRLSEIERLLPLASEGEKKELAEEQRKLAMRMRASGKGSFKAHRSSRGR
ncbi:MAG TPA: DNA primase [Gemmatimonadaceae bacterium]